MNKAIIIGRLVRDPDIRYADSGTSIARWTTAVDRRYKKDGEQNADFISCIAFGKTAEFVEKYFRQGSKIVIEGRIQTGSYTNKDGQKVYTTDVIAEQVEFGESKSAGGGDRYPAQPSLDELNDGFVSVADAVDDELPFA